jgi:hypothetical protein
MYYIIEKSHDIKFKLDFYTEVLDMLENLNKRLSKVYMEEGYKSYYNNHPGFENYVHKGTLFVSWNYSLSDDSLSDNSLSDINIISIGMGYLTNYDILSENKKLPDDQLIELKMDICKYINLLLLPIENNELDYDEILKPNNLLDLMFKKCLTDPYQLFINFLGINEDNFYQAYILYLNITIEYTPTVDNPDIINIRNNFFKNSDVSNMQENLKKYDNLLLFYLHNKKITPFNITYKDYSN